MSNNHYAHSHTREAVRVKVKKYEANVSPEWRKFSVDPQITSLEVLYSLLAKAFETKSDFSIKYKAFDPAGNETYLPVLSDWDLDAAFLRIHNIAIQTSTEPCLILQIDIKPFTEVKEWDGDNVTTQSNVQSSSSSSGSNFSTAGARELMSPLQQSFGVSQKYVQHMQTKLPGLIMNQMEKTFSIVQKAFNMTEETLTSLPPRVPLSDNEFRMFLDALGQIQRNDDLRKVIFFGGIEPSLRRVVWKHILNIYPRGMTGHQRMDYMRRKSEQYYKMRDIWKIAVKQGCVAGELSYVTSMVKKDVLRTDRLHPFYAGSDDNQNIASLFNILTTFALNHPSVSYCQGMSDIASPLLVTMNDEAQAYICFCAIMARMKGNFMLDGISMTQKFAHLTEALSVYDPVFWEYLKSQQADDLLFCYRWLLLELKREFPFEDALRMLEVQWSSLKYENTVNKELGLFEKEFVPSLDSPTLTTSSSISGSFGAQPTSPSYFMVKPRESVYTKVCALRRQSSSVSLSSLSSSISSSTNALGAIKLDSTKRLNQSLDENIARHAARRQRRTSSKAHQSLDESKMLMLIESSEHIKTLPDNKSTKSDRISNINDFEIIDDDVFVPSTNKDDIDRINDTNYFNFHPTNPFKDDAKCNGEQSTNLFTRDEGQQVFEYVDEEERTISSNIPSGLAKLQNKNIISNYNTVSNIIAKQLANASTVSENVKRVSGGGGGHFKELKEKIAASSRKGISFDDPSTNLTGKSQQKLVKNFNEFLNFASINKSRIADKLSIPENTLKNVNQNTSHSPSPTHAHGEAFAQVKTPTGTITKTPHPLVQLTKSNFTSLDDSEDSSSVPDTTWSGSTAATAIQQNNNLSSNSLHLELNSLSSSTQTPDRTPTLDDRHQMESKLYGINIKSPQKDVTVTPDDMPDQDYYPMSTAITRELRLEAENLDRQVFGDLNETKNHVNNFEIEYENLDLKENEIVACPDISELLQRRRQRTAKSQSLIEPIQSAKNDRNWDSNVDEVARNIDKNLNLDVANKKPVGTIIDDFNVNSFEDDNLPFSINGLSNSNSLPEVIVPISTEVNDSSPIEMGTNADDVISLVKSSEKKNIKNRDCVDHNSGAPMEVLQAPVLPPPTELGGGNPFLMFLCLTLLLQHRNTIMKAGMDYNEIAMHFDKMVRKHDVTRVLNQARSMYIDYLKAQNSYNRKKEQLAQSKLESDINRNSNGSILHRMQKQQNTAA